MWPQRLRKKRVAFSHHAIGCRLVSDSVSAPPSPPPRSTPKLKNRPPSPAAPKSRPLSPLVPAAAASKTPTGKKTPPPTSGAKTRPKRAQTPARVQPQAVAAVSVEKELDLQQPTGTEEKKGECASVQVSSSDLLFVSLHVE